MTPEQEAKALAEMVLSLDRLEDKPELYAKEIASLRRGMRRKARAVLKQSAWSAAQAQNLQPTVSHLANKLVDEQDSHMQTKAALINALDRLNAANAQPQARVVDWTRYQTSALPKPPDYFQRNYNYPKPPAKECRHPAALSVRRAPDYVTMTPGILVCPDCRREFEWLPRE